MNNQTRLLLKLLLLCCLTLVMEISLFSQVIVNPYACPDQLTLPPGCQGEAYGITFETTGGAGSSWQVLPPSTTGLNFADPTSSELTGPISPLASTTVPHTITIQAVIGGSTVDFTFTINVENCGQDRDPVCPCLKEIVYVLDRSGSMAWDADDVTPGLQPRWDILATGIDNHIGTLAASADLDLNDRWGLVFFDGDHIPIAAPITGDFNVIPTLAPHFSTLPDGGTPMGGGLQVGINDFFTGIGVAGEGKQRYIVLVTDGAQNMNPMFDETDQNLRNLPLPSRPPDGVNGAVGLPFDVKTIDPSIKLYPISVHGAATPATNVPLTQMSLINNPVGSIHTSLTAMDLQTHLNSVIQAALGSCSPRIVNIKRGTTPLLPNSIKESFSINDSVTSVTFQLLAVRENFEAAQVKVYKDGVLIPIEPISSSSSMVLLDYNFPLSLPTGSIITSPKGNWEIEISDYKATDYQLTAIVDEKYLNHDIDFGGENSFYAGDDLPVRATLTYKEEFIPGATVEVFLLSPTEDIGDLIADLTIPLPTNKENEQTDGQAKIDSALQILSILEQLKSEDRYLLLDHKQNGIYEGLFKNNVDNNKVTGAYQVILRVSGNHPNSGKFEGWETRYAIFDFARPDEINLNEKFDVIGKQVDNLDIYQITITPTNKFGKKIGPAQEQRIKLTSQQGSIYDFKDNLDGSYSARIQVPVGVEPEIDVFVIDKEKKVKTIRPTEGKKGVGISVHYGIAGSFNNTPPLDTLTRGTFWEVDLSYQFNPKWAIGAIGGNYRMDESFDISGGGLFLQRSIPRTFITRIAVGASGYKPSNQDWTYGVNGKLSFSRQFGNRLDIGIDGGLIYLPEPDYQIWTLGAGIRFYF